MNLSAFNTKKHAEVGQFMQLLHPSELYPLVDENDKPIGITLKGSDSATFRKIASESGRKEKAKGKKSDDLTQYEKNCADEELNADKLAQLTTGFTGIFDDIKDDEVFVEVQFSTKAATKLYVKYPAIFEQVQAFILDRGNFIKS